MTSLLSVVVPCFNEEHAVAPFVERLRPALDGLSSPYEVLLVNDGSADRTATALTEAATGWPEVMIVEHEQNLGQQRAIATGLLAARGDHVVTLDADLQDPPELIPALVAAATNVDIVYARRTARPSDTRFVRITAAVFYRLVALIMGVPVVNDSAEFRLMSRRAVDGLLQLPTELQVHRVALPWLRLPSTSVAYERGPRVAGSGHYTIRRMARLAQAGVRTAVRLRIAPPFNPTR